MARVQLTNLVKHYGSIEAVKSINLAIGSGEFTVLVGPSGCGKSTTLRMIAGLEDVTTGDIQIAGRSVVRVSPSKREIAMVFQSYALYPHLTVADNMGFSLRVRKRPKPEIQQRVLRAAEMLKIENLLDRKPGALSGGQRQRVAIGRAIVRNPKVFLFDEPLSNLDAALRVEMRLELARLHNSMDTTMIYVTHDQVEAMTLADRIVVMSQGVIEQVGTPEEIFSSPQSLFVAGFIGAPKMNFLPARIAGAANGSTDVALKGGQKLQIGGGFPQASSEITLGVRPEHIVLADDDGGFDFNVGVSENLGSESILYGDIEGGQDLVVKVDAALQIKSGHRVKVTPRPGFCHVFGSDGYRL